MSPLPLFFMVLASVALLSALIALWSSLRTALSAAAGQGAGESLDAAELPDRAALLDEKKSLLRAIKDLEYEHAVGKIAAEDFERLNHAYRVRAKEVLGLLEKDLLPYQARAEALIAQAIPTSAGAPAAAREETATEPRKKAAPTSPASESELRDRARALREEAERLERLAAGTPAPDEAKNDEEPGGTASEGERS